MKIFLEEKFHGEPEVVKICFKPIDKTILEKIRQIEDTRILRINENEGEILTWEKCLTEWQKFFFNLLEKIKIEDEIEIIL
jgi:hypothetical protein